MNRPPLTITLKWCPKCGRDDRVQPFTGKGHYYGGQRCPGTPVMQTYVHRIDAL
jgi:hypothetical protein